MDCVSAAIESRGEFAVDFQKQVIKRNFESIIGDREFLTHQSELQELLLDATMYTAKTGG